MVLRVSQWKRLQVSRGETSHLAGDSSDSLRGFKCETKLSETECQKVTAALLILYAASELITRHAQNLIIIMILILRIFNVRRTFNSVSLNVNKKNIWLPDILQSPCNFEKKRSIIIKLKVCKVWLYLWIAQLHMNESVYSQYNKYHPAAILQTGVKCV